MFSSLGLFKHLPCPVGDQCRLTNCIFSHTAPPEDDAAGKQSNRAAVKPASDNSPSAKRRKIDNGAEAKNLAVAATHPKSQVSQIRATTSSPAGGGLSSRVSKVGDGGEQVLSSLTGSRNISTISRPVSPPVPKSRLDASVEVKAARPPQKAETLNPRLLKHDPVGHGRRTIYLKALHLELEKLNAQVGESKQEVDRSLQLTASGLISRALDEEEKIGRDQPAVYANVIKLQIVKYRRMAVGEWIELRRGEEELRVKKSKAKDGHPLETGLSVSEEITMLRRLVTKQDGLDQWGYVTSAPSEADIEVAKEGIKASGGYEECDRCRTRFQVFPDRREDGALTSGGRCTYHWGKIVRPKREKTDAIEGTKESRYSCCSEALGSRGCTEAETHVFRVSEAKRLAAVLPFDETSDESKGTVFEAICFDCEMGYTVNGTELIRITAVSWPEGLALLDVLVRPLGAVLDLNTRFSGVTPSQLANAKPFDISAWFEKIDKVRNKEIEILQGETEELLGIVPSPGVARSLLTSLLNRQTLLLGHALENDLNSVRLVHPRIVDTVFLFPHPRGLPLRNGLRALALQYLNRHIQMAGSQGHSSLEDARATGDVARWKVKLEWAEMRRNGWKVKDGEFFAPGETEALKELPLDPKMFTEKPRARGTKRKSEGTHYDAAEETDHSMGE